ncbi:uncharacterized protein BKA78DRAFT_296503 [Phyllosticta capitalensis]|uniref:uncharacterized protein n=1 Tax=Phyllosticta capitalensis TaxID=121624 RepID=UPI0031321A58
MQHGDDDSSDVFAALSDDEAIENELNISKDDNSDLFAALSDDEALEKDINIDNDDNVDLFAALPDDEAIENELRNDIDEEIEKDLNDNDEAPELEETEKPIWLEEELEVLGTKGFSAYLLESAYLQEMSCLQESVYLQERSGKRFLPRKVDLGVTTQSREATVNDILAAILKDVQTILGNPDWLFQDLKQINTTSTLNAGVYVDVLETDGTAFAPENLYMGSTIRFAKRIGTFDQVANSKKPREKGRHTYGPEHKVLEAPFSTASCVGPEKGSQWWKDDSRYTCEAFFHL